MINLIFIASFGFMIFCVYMARQAVLVFKKAKESRHWPATEGVLTDVRLWGKRRINDEMIDSEYLSVSYEYDIDGVQYSGSEVAFFQLHYPETIEFVKAKPKGAQVQVSYNPKDFKESVLVPGTHPTKPYGGLILAFLGVTVSGAVSAAAWLGILE